MEAGGKVPGQAVWEGESVPLLLHPSHTHPQPCTQHPLPPVPLLCQVGSGPTDTAAGWELPEAVGVLWQWRSHTPIHVDAADTGGSMGKLQSHGPGHNDLMTIFKTVAWLHLEKSLEINLNKYGKVCSCRLDHVWFQPNVNDLSVSAGIRRDRHSCTLFSLPWLGFLE